MIFGGFKMRDEVIKIVNVWRYRGCVYILFVDQWNRYRTFAFLSWRNGFYEAYRDMVSDYELQVSLEDQHMIERAVRNFNEVKEVVVREGGRRESFNYSCKWDI